MKLKTLWILIGAICVTVIAILIRVNDGNEVPLAERPDLECVARRESVIRFKPRLASETPEITEKRYQREAVERAIAEFRTNEAKLIAEGAALTRPSQIRNPLAGTKYAARSNKITMAVLGKQADANALVAANFEKRNQLDQVLKGSIGDVEYRKYLDREQLLALSHTIPDPAGKAADMREEVASILLDIVREAGESGAPLKGPSHLAVGVETERMRPIFDRYTNQIVGYLGPASFAENESYLRELAANQKIRFRRR